MTKGEVLALNYVLSGIAVKGLPRRAHTDIVRLKLELGELATAIAREEELAVGRAIESLGSEPVSDLRRMEAAAKAVGEIRRSRAPEPAPETRALTADELYDCALSLPENDSLRLEEKATLMKYLVKEGER